MDTLLGILILPLLVAGLWLLLMWALSKRRRDD